MTKPCAMSEDDYDSSSSEFVDNDAESDESFEVQKKTKPKVAAAPAAVAVKTRKSPPATTSDLRSSSKKPPKLSTSNDASSKKSSATEAVAKFNQNLANVAGSPSSGIATKTTKKTPEKSKAPLPDAIDIAYPTHLEQETTVVVQVDPQDAAGLSLEGVVGAIGRMESDMSKNEVLFDLNGTQYRGTVFPSATLLVLTLQNKAADAAVSYRVESMNSEVCRLEPLGKSTRLYDARIEGNMEGSTYQEEDVNRAVRGDAAVAEADHGGTIATARTVPTNKRARKGQSSGGAGRNKGAKRNKK